MSIATTAASRPWRPRGVPTADEGAHQEPEIEAADVHEQPLQNVRVAAEMRAPHAPGLVEMRVRAFQVLAPSPQQGQAPRAVDASTIRIDRVAGGRLLLPACGDRDRVQRCTSAGRAPPNPSALGCCGTPCPRRSASITAVWSSVAVATASSSSAAAVTVSAIVVVSP